MAFETVGEKALRTHTFNLREEEIDANAFNRGYASGSNYWLRRVLFYKESGRPIEFLFTEAEIQSAIASQFENTTER
jgi:hypothetical protein